MTKNTEDLYNQTAAKWQRREPNSLSDFTARPKMFELCGDITGKKIIDLGAGEGYCARVLAEQSPDKIFGVELSEEMVSLAKKQQEPSDNIIEYSCGTVTDLKFDNEFFDIALGVFVYNYLDIASTAQSFKEVFRTLKPGADFLFSVPHPSFPFIKKNHDKPFYFDVKDHGYFSSRDKLCSGEIFCRDGTPLNVQMIPKSLEDYFFALKSSGFSSLPEVYELGVTEDMIAVDPDFFTPLKDIPLHLAFKLTK